MLSVHVWVFWVCRFARSCGPEKALAAQQGLPDLESLDLEEDDSIMMARQELGKESIKLQYLEKVRPHSQLQYKCSHNAARQLCVAGPQNRLRTSVCASSPQGSYGSCIKHGKWVACVLTGLRCRHARARKRVK